jgi:KDO2-lipid IV(A) lauroyltransferase
MSTLFWSKKQRSQLLKNAGLRSEAAALQLFWWCMGLLSPQRASATGDRLLRWLGPRSVKFRKIRANLMMAFPEKEAAEIDRLTRSVLGSLGAVLAEFAHLEDLTDMQRPDPYLEFVNLNQDPAFLARDKPCIFVSGHLANWELITFALAHCGYPADGLYTPLSNPWLDRMIDKRRRLMKGNPIPRTNALRQLLKSLKQGRSVGMHTDVRIDDRHLLPFFGSGAGITTLPAWLSIKTGYEIVPVYCERTGRAR